MTDVWLLIYDNMFGIVLILVVKHGFTDDMPLIRVDKPYFYDCSDTVKGLSKICAKSYTIHVPYCHILKQLCFG